MLYASLTGPLLGLYYPIPTDDEEEARLMMSTSKLKDLWCSIYTPLKVCEMIEKFGGIRLPLEWSSKLDYDSFAIDELKNGIK